ncbi:ATP-binding cassette domain-containing protein [Cohnella abietis]|uniref:ABC transporter domain-containing protein n=1 Tax=Cohnella abietis TaxID=2507935 RepID=A0A3T1D8E4_9BACL|nr:ATP-binding cassette domain-containing protein [Cohnella abietis]BBI34344.1 hypothetical protein KCTCHS21_37430 [Cohnella abietis]
MGAGKRITQRDNNDKQALPLLVNGIAWRLGEGDEHQDPAVPLELAPGKITLLMGPNGAGKTTLLEKLAGLRSPEGLQISYGLEPLWRVNRFGKLRLNENALRQYSYACQSPEEGLFARSIREELVYSLKPYSILENEREELIDSALAAVGWDSSWLSRDPYLMSGGERRRSALASVFVTPASWFLLDEPTSGLDGAGHETVARQLLKMKTSGSGILLVSHDSDWALPLADCALLLSADGSVRMCTPEQLLMHPEWLAETGMQIPEWLELAHLLWRSGVASDKVWNPVEAAAEQKVLGHPAEAVAEQIKVRDSENTSSLQSDIYLPYSRSVELEKRKRSVSKVKAHRLIGFDPRSVWLAYVILSTGLFFLKDWISILVGAIVVIGLLIVGRISLLRWRGLIINYAVFSIVTSTIFAWGASGNSGSIIEWGAFTGTLFTFTRTMLILLLGLAIPLVMTPLSLRRSLEQMISFKGTTLGWAQSFILTVTLIMRFVPVLLGLWGRFVRIFLARGKSIARNPLAIGKRIRDVSLPFLLALFRLGDEVALALESRGVGYGVIPTRAIRLKWRKQDYGLVAMSLALAIGLWLFTKRNL